MTKVLIVRFSSIGDIVLTTPVIRCLKLQKPEIEIHYLTKKIFLPVLEYNPYINKIFTISKEITEIIPDLKAEKYDFVLDLHNNLRTRRLGILLGVTTFRFDKLNTRKWLMVQWKINSLPAMHIVDRYFKVLEFFGIVNDTKGLDYFYAAEDKLVVDEIKSRLDGKYIAFVVGGAHFTKQIPVEILQKLAMQSMLPVVLLGGKNDEVKAQQIQGSKVLNMCGKLSLHQSAAVIHYSEKVLSSDTGLMHIAAAFHRPILSLWGNTIPEFGMYPYMPESNAEKNLMFEVKDLKCRPCSKIGYAKCPKKHFDCMMKQDISDIVNALNR